MTNQLHYDVIIIGAGIAGVSLAARLAEQGQILLLDMEPHPGFHATGRSAAYFAPSYGNEVIRALTGASTHFYADPNDYFEGQLLRPRPALFIAQINQQESIQTMLQEQPNLHLLDTAEIQSLVPVINQEINSGLLDDSGGDLDVDLIMQGLIRQFRENKGTLITDAKVQRIKRDTVWQVETKESKFQAPIVVNAAGAWADEIAMTAGLEPLNLQPLKRTAILVDPPGDDIIHWPLVVDVDEHFYFKPDAGKLLLSPADETPSEPMDAYPNEFDMALADDRVSQVTSLTVKRINHQWAGLRTFAQDKTPVVGFDDRSDGFFWLAGQGGYGVQTAPGVARLAAELCTSTSVSTEFQPWLDAINPARLVTH